MNRLKIKIGFVITLGLISLTILSAYTLVTSITSAITVSGESPLTATANAAVHVADACTMTGTLNTAHTATIKPGITHVTDYPDGIGLTTLNVVCNDNGGYAIYAAGYTGGEVGGTNSTKLIGETTNLAISTGTATSGSTSNWSMKLFDTGTTNPPTIASGFNAFHDVPADYTLVASKTGSTGSTASTIKATYGAYIAGTQAADTYNGKVIYIMVHPTTETPPVEVACANNKICYNANTNIKQGTMGQQTGNANASVTLLASNFSRDGYGFVGWNTKPDYSGDFYGPNETITVPSTASSGGTPLYAVWVKSSGTLQGWSGCSSLTKADEATDILSQSIRALTDQRDGQTYAIAKLADGNCWMIENLRLDNDATGNATGTLAQGYNSSFAGLADPESANFSNSTTANTLYRVDTDTTSTAANVIDTASHTDGSTDYSGYSFPRYNRNNTYSRASSPTTSGNNIYGYGNYYTWAAAIADTNFYRTNNQSITTTSLCPTGWHLPIAGQYTVNTGNYYYLLSKALTNLEPNQNNTNGYGYYSGSVDNVDYGATVSKALRSYPNNFLYSGNFTTSSAYGRGSRGNYWSSTAGSGGNSYLLLLNSSNVDPGTSSSNKNYGRSIRCVAGS